MKLIMATLFAICLTTPTWAANLTDVKILELNYTNEKVVLKLHASQGPEDSYFFVNMSKVDPDSFNKLALLAKKLAMGDRLKLNLNIRSFSVSPSGSSYQSNSVSFKLED